MRGSRLTRGDLVEHHRRDRPRREAQARLGIDRFGRPMRLAGAQTRARRQAGDRPGGRWSASPSASGPMHRQRVADAVVGERERVRRDRDGGGGPSARANALDASALAGGAACAVATRTFGDCSPQMAKPAGTPSLARTQPPCRTAAQCRERATYKVCHARGTRCAFRGTRGQSSQKGGHHIMEDRTEIIETTPLADTEVRRHARRTYRSPTTSRAGAPSVDRTETVAYDPYESRRHDGATASNQLVYWIFGLIEGLIADSLRAQGARAPIRRRALPSSSTASPIRWSPRSWGCSATRRRRAACSSCTRSWR